MIWLLTSVLGYSFAMLVIGFLVSVSLARPVMPPLRVLPTKPVSPGKRPPVVFAPAN
jgi:hypothetical protein